MRQKVAMSLSIFLRSLRLTAPSMVRYHAQRLAANPSRLPQAPHANRFTTSAPSNAAVAATDLPAQPTVLLDTPSLEYLHKEEIDIDLLPPEQVKLVITDRAAEQLRSIATREDNPDSALRISVESGGCHGYQYKMELAKTRALDDYHFTHPTIQPANILIDAISLSLVNGSTIDFATELIGSSFRVEENPQSKGSGCGCGVSWQLKE